MSIPIEEAKKLPSYESIHNQNMEKLKKIGTALGFDTDSHGSLKTPIGNLDCAWRIKNLKLPNINGPIPFAAFEVICSEDRKQLKGSVLNLISSKSSLAVLCLIRKEIKKPWDGCKDKEPEKWLITIENLVEKLQKEFSGITRILIWNEEDIDDLYRREIDKCT